MTTEIHAQRNCNCNCGNRERFVTITYPLENSVLTALDHVAGTATPGAIVHIIIDCVSYGSATSGSNGAWRLDLASQSFPRGQHKVIAQTGSVKASVYFTIA